MPKTTPDPDELPPEESRPPGDRRTAEEQRDRILAAVAVVVAEQGYPALTLERVTEASGLSEPEFRDHFASTGAALEAATDRSVERFVAVVLGACSAQEEWPLKVKVAIGAALDHAAASPAQAALLDPQGQVAGHPAARKAGEARDRLASSLNGGRRYSESGADLPTLTEQWVAAGLIGLARRRIAEGEADRLPDLAPQFVEFALLPYLGQADAARIANRPPAGREES